MSRSERQQLDQRLRLAEPPTVGHHDIADPHSEPAEQPDPHGRHRHVARHQLLTPHRSLSGSAAQGVPTTIPESGCPGQGGWPTPAERAGRGWLRRGRATAVHLVDQAVAPYPLLDLGGEAFGVLSFHFRRRPQQVGGAALVAHRVAGALTHLTAEARSGG